MKFKPSVLIILADNISRTKQGGMSLNKTVEEYFHRELKLNDFKVETIDLFKDYKAKQFDPILDLAFSNEKIQEYQIKIKQYDHFIFIYSSIWSGLPALLKGFLDTVFVEGFAFEPGSKSVFGGKGYLNNKTAQVFVMEERGFMHSVINNNNSDKVFWQRNIFAQTGIVGEIKYFYETSCMNMDKLDNINREVKKSIFKISPLAIV